MMHSGCDGSLNYILYTYDILYIIIYNLKNIDRFILKSRLHINVDQISVRCSNKLIS